MGKRTYKSSEDKFLRRLQINSLVSLAEEGVQVEEIAQRIRKLEAERKGLEQLAIDWKTPVTPMQL